MGLLYEHCFAVLKIGEKLMKKLIKNCGKKLMKKIGGKSLEKLAKNRWKCLEKIKRKIGGTSAKKSVEELFKNFDRNCTCVFVFVLFLAALAALYLPLSLRQLVRGDQT